MAHERTEESASTAPVANLQPTPDGCLQITVGGTWHLGSVPPESERILAILQRAPKPRAVRIHGDSLGEWDSSLPVFLTKVQRICRRRNLPIREVGVPEGCNRLLRLADAPVEEGEHTGATIFETFLAIVGEATLGFVAQAGKILHFMGQTTLALLRLASGNARLRTVDVIAVLRTAGPEALPIITLIALLMGLILAFVGALQLRIFGAEIYIANLVGIGIVRELGAIMTGIVMAGRTGASFAAQLGTMEVNEEIDAFHTMGISPIDFLVLPRLIGLTIMMPVLCLYADFMGVLGGMLVSITVFKMSPLQYVYQTRTAIDLGDLGVGLFMSLVFGVLVAVAGCQRGMSCERSASSVGEAATRAVVDGIVSIIVATAIITVICSILGI